MSEERVRAENVRLASKSPGPFELHEKGEAETSDLTPKDLKRKTALGALLSTGAQLGTVVLRAASFMILARLLLKEDFGLVNMVTAVIGFLGIVRDGLSMATIQRVSLTGAQTSTVFWVNAIVGSLLALLTAIAAPIVVAF